MKRKKLIAPALIPAAKLNPADVRVLVGIESKRGFLNSTSSSAIYCYEETATGDVRILSTVVRGCIEAVTVRETPYSTTKQYQVRFATPDGRSINLSGTLPDIFKKLEAEPLVCDPGKIRAALNALIAVMRENGKATVIKELDVKGFCLGPSGDLTSQGIPTELNRVKLRAALKVLTEVVMVWFALASGKAATVIKWLLVAPFCFAKKQMRTMCYRWIVLIGPTGTGKSTIGQLGAYIWGLLLSQYENSLASINTEARLGSKLSTWTFSLMINETGKLFERGSSSLIELIKNAWDGLTVRGRYRSGVYDEELSLAPLLMTSNVPLNLPQGARRRFRTIHFLWKEKPDKSRQKEFETWRSKLAILSHMAPYIVEIVNADRSILDGDDFETAGEIILKRLFKAAGQRVPEWVKLRDNGQEDSSQMSRDELKSAVVDLLNQYVIERLKTANSFDIKIQKTLLLRLSELKTLSVPTDVMLYAATASEPKVVLKRGFLQYLVAKKLEIGSLRELAEILDGEYYPEKCIRTLKVAGLSVAMIPLFSLEFRIPVQDIPLQMVAV